VALLQNYKVIDGIGVKVVQSHCFAGIAFERKFVCLKSISFNCQIVLLFL